MLSSLGGLVPQSDQGIPRDQDGFRRTIKIDVRLGSNAWTLHRLWPLRETLQYDMLHARVAERGGNLPISQLNAAKTLCVVLDVAIDPIPHPDREAVATSLTER